MERVRLEVIRSSQDLFELIQKGASGSWRWPQPFQDTSPLHQLGTLLFTKLGCVCVLVQSPVHDHDYASEYATYYSSTFEEYPRYCSRLHFFSQAPKDGQRELDFLDQIANEGGTHYLGFVTLRPLARACVGKTIIRAPEDFSLTIKEKVLVKLAGTEMTLEGAPFLQQDSAVGVCAQASIWMALNALNDRHHKEPATLAEITQRATKTLVEARIFPARDGLSSFQIRQALYQYGYHGTLIDINNPDPIFQQQFTSDTSRKIAYAKFAIYPYIESGIPVIAFIKAPGQEFHAVVVVGYEWDERAAQSTINITSECLVPNAPFGARMWLASPVSWIRRFYIHNDAQGPYLPLDDMGSGCTLAHISVLYPLLHQRVYMTALEAQTAAQGFLAKLLYSMLGGQKFQQQHEAKWSDVEGSLVLRPLLRTRHEFRKWAAQHTTGELNERYRTFILPEYLWVMEIYSNRDYFSAGLSKSDAAQPERLGELLVDATEDPKDDPILTVRLGAALLKPREAQRGALVIKSSALGETKVIELS